jgi:hypothetical protein
MREENLGWRLPRDPWSPTSSHLSQVFSGVASKTPAPNLQAES